MKLRPRFVLSVLAAVCVLVSGCGKSGEADQKAAALESQVSDLKSRASGLQSKVSALEAAIDRLNSQLNGINSQLSTSAAPVKALQNEVHELRKLLPQPPAPAATAATPAPREELPYGVAVVGKKGMVYSPYAPEKGQIDVEGYKRGTRIECPYTGKPFRVP